jgi:hypothetical protein
MTVLTGLEFKQQYPYYQAVKIIGNNKNNYHYQLGLNIDPIPYQPSSKCQANSLYFIDIEYLEYYIHRECTINLKKNIFIYPNYGYQIAYIDIVDDSNIYLEDSFKYKTDKIFITKIISFQDYFSQLTEEKLFKFIQIASHIIQHIPNPTKEWQLAAVRQNGYCIQYINNPDKDVQLEAVQKPCYGYAIQYINNPDIDVQLASIKYDIYSLTYINNPHSFVIAEAMRKSSYSIHYINKIKHN